MVEKVVRAEFYDGDELKAVIEARAHDDRGGGFSVSIEGLDWLSDFFMELLGALLRPL